MKPGWERMTRGVTPDGVVRGPVKHVDPGGGAVKEFSVADVTAGNGEGTLAG